MGIDSYYYTQLPTPTLKIQNNQVKKANKLDERTVIDGNIVIYKNIL